MKDALGNEGFDALEYLDDLVKRQEVGLKAKDNSMQERSAKGEKVSQEEYSKEVWRNYKELTDEVKDCARENRKQKEDEREL